MDIIEESEKILVRPARGAKRKCSAFPAVLHWQHDNS